MRMCYLSISHTNVFSVTVPPGRLQEGSGALIKAVFAGQECGLLHRGVMEGLGVCSPGHCSQGRWAGVWAHGQCARLPSGIFPSLLPFLPDLLYHQLYPAYSHATIQSPPIPTLSYHSRRSFSPLAYLLSPGWCWASRPPLRGQLCSEAAFKKSHRSYCSSLHWAQSSKVKSRFRAKSEKLIRGICKDRPGKGRRAGHSPC